MNAQPQPDPGPPPSSDLDDERQERQEVIAAYNARRAAEGLPPLEPARVARFLALDEEVKQRATAQARKEKQRQADTPGPDPYAGMDGELAKALRNMERHRRELAATEGPQAPAREPPKPEAPGREARPATAPKRGIITNFPIIPASTRAVVNEIASSALFAAIQGKDRKLVKDMPVAATGETQVFFTGELLNQDDHDVFMLLVCLASTKPAGEYVVVSAHSLLKALGRKTGGTAHKQLDAEIKRLTHAGVEIKTRGYTYIGHLIHDAVKHEETKNWIYALNEKLVTLYGASGYTLIDWEQRKRLRGKDLARWLQLEIARHTVPFPVKVETLRRLSGSTAKELYHFRATLKKALNELQAEGHIAAWLIDENDLLHVDRGAALTASQRRSLARPTR